MTCCERGEHSRRVRQNERFVVGAAERAGPRVEQLEGARPVIELALQRSRRVLHQTLHHLIPQCSIGVHHPLGVLVGAARLALDQVAGNGERSPGECQQRDVVGQFGGEDLDGLQHVRSVGFGLEDPQPVEISGGAQRRLAHRAGARRHVDTEPDSVGRHDDVAVEHSCVHAVPAHRLQGQFGGEIRLFDGVEDAALASPGPIFGKASACLAHEPHGSVRPTFAVGRQEEWRVRHACRTLPVRRRTRRERHR